MFKYIFNLSILFRNKPSVGCAGAGRVYRKTDVSARAEVVLPRATEEPDGGRRLQLHLSRIKAGLNAV